MLHNEKILVIDKDEQQATNLKVIFDFIGEGVELSSFATWREKLTQDAWRCVVIDMTDGDNRIIDEVKALHKKAPKLPFILIGQNKDVEELTKSKQQYPIISVLSYPLNYTQVLEALNLCQAYREKDIASDKDIHYGKESAQSLVGHNPAIKHVRNLIEQVAKTEANVLVLGESGTGKEVVAKNIHMLSKRSQAPFVPINCGAIPSELLESELFGHEKGAFTGALTSRQGRFELARGGTLFLDEIGDMPLTMQVKLLRVLEERTFERVGSNKSILADVRIIAATHRNLEDEITKGRFREDLYYRLNVFPIDLPALRERTEDIPLLINELSMRLTESSGTPVRLMPDAISALCQYDWPGNVRELANLIERLSILYPNTVIERNILPKRFRANNALSGHSVELDNLASEEGQSDNAQVVSISSEGIDLKEHLIKTELALITQALEENDWVVARAAVYLSMRRTTLVEKMRKYGITRPEKVD